MYHGRAARFASTLDEVLVLGVDEKELRESSCGRRSCVNKFTACDRARMTHRSASAKGYSGAPAVFQRSPPTIEATAAVLSTHSAKVAVQTIQAPSSTPLVCQKGRLLQFKTDSHVTRRLQTAIAR